LGEYHLLALTELYASATWQPENLMARRALPGLAAAAVISGTLFVAAPAALADYPNITPPGGGGAGGGAAGAGGAGGAATGGGGSLGSTSDTTGGAGSSSSLPFTGAEVLPLLGVGAALLLTGSTVLVAGRRRRTQGAV